MAVKAAIHTEALKQPSHNQHLQNFLATYRLSAASAGKWVYLVSESFRFSRGIQGAIHLRPQSSCDRFKYLHAIVTAGQCGVLIVEGYEETSDDWRVTRTLCEQYGVALVNLTSHTAVQDNVITGPW